MCLSPTHSTNMDGASTVFWALHEMLSTQKLIPSKHCPQGIHTLMDGENKGANYSSINSFIQK